MANQATRVHDMAQARDVSFNPPSPHSSSGGGDSYKNEGTPDTRLTAFSPEDGSARSSKPISALSLSSTSKPHPVRFHVPAAEAYTPGSSAAEKDPFISSSSASSSHAIKSEPKLSPTASAFRPVSTTPLVARSSYDAITKMATRPSTDFQRLGYLFNTKFSGEQQISRYLVLFSSKNLTLHADEYLTTLERHGFKFFGTHSVQSRGDHVCLRFTNIRDAIVVHDNVKLGSPDWGAAYVTPFDFYQGANPGVRLDDIIEGQVSVVAFPPSAFTAGFDIGKDVEHFFRGLGDVFVFRALGEARNPFQALVEFADVDVAAAVVASKYSYTVLPNGIHVMLTNGPRTTTTMVPEPSGSYVHAPSPMNEISNMLRDMSVSKTPTAARALVPATGSSGYQSSVPLVPQQPQMPMYHPVVYQTVPAPPSYLMDQTPTRRPTATPMTPLTPMSSRDMPIMGPIFTPPATPMTMQSDYTSPRSMQAYARTDGRRQNAMRVNRSPFYNAAGHHNHVDVTRIREGIDVRTTIMLRNIPNKVDQPMLKDIIDESSWGKYDFMYLRIDFANDCNVGYAFINFVDPLDIIGFVNARGNQRWNCFKSDKIAEISYATIQGKDCLVQKFRNSSVMLEQEKYRPKLYFTVNGPHPELAGKEEKFPEPDNQSKMKRSCENAEHVGLFTPNAGQHFRDEQRRRRSQYDRGTRLAVLEEFGYGADIPQQVLYSPQ